MTKRSRAVKHADTWMSRYVRRAAADHSGRATCFTCGKQGDWLHEMQAGHFMSRVHYSTRWHEWNVKCQCPGCNMKNGGQQYIFGVNLDSLHGSGTADRMVTLSKQTTKLSTDEIRQIGDDFKRRYDDLQNGVKAHTKKTRLSKDDRFQEILGI